MLIEEEEPKGGDVNPDALEAVFEEEVVVEEEEVFILSQEDSDDEVEIAFDPNDEGYW
jgi:hypothetical protein